MVSLGSHEEPALTDSSSPSSITSMNLEYPPEKTFSQVALGSSAGLVPQSDLVMLHASSTPETLMKEPKAQSRSGDENPYRFRQESGAHSVTSQSDRGATSPRPDRYDRTTAGSEISTDDTWAATEARRRSYSHVPAKPTVDPTSSLRYPAPYHLSQMTSPSLNMTLLTPVDFRSERSSSSPGSNHAQLRKPSPTLTAKKDRVTKREYPTAHVLRKDDGSMFSRNDIQVRHFI